MRHPLASSVLAVAVATTALAGCGGGGGDNAAPAQPAATTPFMGTTVQSLLDYMNQLIAQTSETTEPEPVDSTPLPVDDTV
jgi:ABC-type glycerol-3-phosphate transport system substrate-binding protein